MIQKERNIKTGLQVGKLNINFSPAADLNLHSDAYW